MKKSRIPGQFRKCKWFENLLGTCFFDKFKRFKFARIVFFKCSTKHQ